MLLNYAVFQIKSDKTRELGFISLDLFKAFTKQSDVIKMHGVYDLVYEDTIDTKGNAKSTLERLFEKFNTNHPKDYKGRSMSTGDIVRLGKDYYYCDSFGWGKVKVQQAPTARTLPKSTTR